MATLERTYRDAVRSITHPQGSEERGLEKRLLWKQYQAGLMLRDGAPGIVYRMQSKFATEYYQLVESFYLGKVDDTTYQRRRVRTLRRYAQRLHELKLLRAVFDDAWVGDFARDSLRHERKLLPVPAEPRWTAEDAAVLCDPLREFSKRFFRAVHAEFGVGKLRERAELYGGVDADCLAAEEVWL